MGWVQQWTTSTQFLLWQEHIREETGSHTKDHYYLAQIVQAIIWAATGGQDKRRLEEFLLTFTASRPNNGPMAGAPFENPYDIEYETQEEANLAAAKIAKAAWLTTLGVEG